MVTEKQVQAATETILAAVDQNPGPSLAERELLDFVLGFANEGLLDGPLLRAPGVRVIAPLGAGPEWKPTPADVAPSEFLEHLRIQLRQDLTAVIVQTVSPHGLARLKKAASRMVATPHFTIERRLQRSLRVNWQYTPTSLESLLGYTVLLLLDDQRGFGVDLKRCSLTECGLFFFSSDRTKETGKPRERFCSNDHMFEAHRRTSASRTRKYRARKAREEAKKAGGSK